MRTSCRKRLYFSLAYHRKHFASSIFRPITLQQCQLVQHIHPHTHAHTKTKTCKDPPLQKKYNPVNNWVIVNLNEPQGFIHRDARPATNHVGGIS